MSKPSLPMVMGIKRQMGKKMSCGGAVKMADGGMVEKPESQMNSSFNHKDLAQAVLKKMAGGGMVDEANDDFLSSDSDTELLDVGMPDDTDERMEAMSNGAEDDSHKGILHSVMAKIHRKHKG